VRVLGVDFGQRRIGLALSDPSGTLARPWQTVAAAGSPRASAELVAGVIRAEGGDDAEAVALVVVGVPKRLNGQPTDQTAPAREFAAALQRAGFDVQERDERLTSHEADALLAVNDRDWRSRKTRLDAAAAAVILQEFLDDRARGEGAAR
jgi:putative Holliday junction resolvase